MNVSYWSYEATTPTRWTRAVIYLGEDDLAADFGHFGGTPITIRLLPADPQTKTLVKHLAGTGTKVGRTLLRNRQEKLILVENIQTMFDKNMLATGRLPEPGAGEILAGHDVQQRDMLSIEGKTFKVVGVLRQQNSPFWNCYLLPATPQVVEWLNPSSEQVKPGVLLTRENLREHKDALAKPHVRGSVTAISNLSRVELGPYYLYLLGLFFLFAGGAAMLIEGFLAWSEKATRGWIGPALAEIREHWRLFVGLHVAYFGLCLAGMAVIYFLRDVQDVLFLLTLKGLSGDSGMLGILGKVYLSQNILLAATVTVGINFFAGSFAAITLPSLMLPGSGSLIALFRAGVWGVLLAPAYPDLAGSMLAHSATLLVEGEGYILATFFGLLVPVFLLRRQEGIPFLQRWQRALVVNFKGNLLVLLVLAVAALYEGVEVIMQMQK